MGKVELRTVGEKDAPNILKWANDPLTRKMSFNTSKISEKEHSIWFSKHSKSPETRLFIAFNKNIPIGICKFHKLNSHTWETGINLAPEFRGKKLGIEVLLAGCNAIRREFPYCGILARTRPENLSFRSIAEQAGFEEKGSSQVNGNMALELFLS